MVIALSIFYYIVLFMFPTFLDLVIFSHGIVLEKNYIFDINYFHFIVFLLLFAILVIEIISKMQIFDSTWHTVFVSLFLLLYYVFSDNGLDIASIFNFSPNVIAYEILNYIFLMLAVFSLIYFIIFTYKIKLPNLFLIIGSTISFTISLVLYTTLMGNNLQYAAYLFFLAFSIAILIILSFLYYKENTFSKKIDTTFALSSSIFIALIGNALEDILYKSEVFAKKTIDYTMIYSFLIILFFITIYIIYAIRTSRSEQKVGKLEIENEKLKQDVLKEQIKPHFIFNSLNAIKFLYHKDIEQGDKTLDLFSKYLRNNIDALNQNLIPFEKELDNIQTFIDLENLKRESPYNIIFDIDYSDFDVPILSIEPFVENAIKYSGVNHKEDGFIMISSYLEDDKIVIKVVDNGKGFNIEKLKKESNGIKNTRQRFKLLYNIDIKIESVEGEGTSITIKLPVIEKENNYENSNS